MTKTLTKAVSTPEAHRPRAWYGVSAREFKALIAAEKNPARLAEMREYAAATAKRRAAKSPRFAEKWAAIAESLATGVSAKPTAKPAKAHKSPKATTADPVAALLKATGMTPLQLIEALASRIA